MPAVHSSNEAQEGVARIPRISLMMGWWSLVSAMFYLYLSALIASIVGFNNAVIGMVLTVAVFGAVNRLLSQYAIDTGFSVELFSRVVFGKIGALLATAVFAATALYYGVFEGSIIAVTFESYTRSSLGWPIEIWYLIVVLYSTPLVFGGVRNWLDRFNGILLPIYAIGLIAAVVVAAVKGEPSGWASLGNDISIPLSDGGPGWLLAFGIYMGVWILMMYTVDFARLGRKEDRAFHGTVTFGWVFYSLAFLANGIIGIFLAYALREYVGATITEGGVAVALTQVMGIWAVLLVWISQTRINTANYYLSSSNLETLGRELLRLKFPRVVWVLVGSTIMYLIMLTNVFSYILTALNWQGVLVTGWVAIAVCHILVDRREGIDPNLAETERVKFASGPGVIAWVISSVIGLTLLEAGPDWAATWGPIVTAVTAAAIYVAARRSTGIKSAVDYSESRAADLV